MPNSLKEKLQHHHIQVIKQDINSPSIFTRFSGYYIELDTYLGNGKERIALQNIFSTLDEHQEIPSKVLIEGGDGMGKSTMLERMSSLWARGEMLDQFDYLFKIKLEFLLDKDWKADYAGRDIQTNPLACLAHYSLEQSIGGRGAVNPYYITVDEIIELFSQEDQSKTVFLADSYDKIAHLVGNKAVKNIINAILEFDNVVMTARHDTMISLTKDSFDRFIRTEGLSAKGALLYVNKHFTLQYELLKKEVESFFTEENWEIADINDFIHYLVHSPLKYEVSKIFKDNFRMNEKEVILDYIDKYYQATIKTIINFAKENSIIQELLRTPMHATMICKVCSDAEVTGRLSTVLTLDELYSELMNKIGERFTEKSLEDEDNIDNIKEFQVLKHLAYKALTSESLSGREIAKISEDFGSNIDRLFSVGLLKVVGVETKTKVAKYSVRRVTDEKIENDSLTNKKFAFVHPSILAYLAASESKDLLMLEKNSQRAREAAEFIASHRDEIYYHIFLKFLAGMVVNLEGKDAIIAITRFWNAVSCDLNETVETGTSGLVTLWMHLLSQSTKNGVIDPRIPNLEAMVVIIDYQVLNNFLQWKKVIEVSGYISDGILTFLENQIDQDRKTIMSVSIERGHSADEDDPKARELGDIILSPSGSKDELNEEDLDSSNRYQVTSPEEAIVKAAIETVGNLASKVDNSRIFSLLLTNLSIYQDSKILEAAVIAITKIVKNRKLGDEDIENFKIKLNLFADHPAAIEALRVIDGYDSKSTIEQSESQSIDMLSNSLELKTEESLSKKPPIVHGDTSLSRALSMPLKVVVMKIKQGLENSKEIKYINLLIDNLATNAIWLKDSWEVRMESLLEILGYSSDDSALYLSPQLKRLAVVVKKVIQSHIKMMNDNEHFEWIVQNFESLQKYAKAESKMVMEYLFYQSLSDNKISDQEGKLITKCIDELDFSITIKPSKVIDSQVTNFVQYNGISYKLSGSANAEQMSKIIEVALLHKKQSPIKIVNSGEGIRIAASDIVKCHSMVDEELELVQDKAQVTFLYLSDHTKASPKDALILVETRGDHFGRHVVYQISVINGKVVIDEYRRHPDDLDTIFRTSILGGMKYDGNPKTKTRYFTQTLEISLDEAYVIIAQARKYEEKQDTSRLSIKSKAGNRENLKEDPMIAKIQILYSLISGLEEQKDNKDSYQKITGDWGLDLNNFIMRNKAIIDAIDVHHTDSLVIGQRELEEGLRELQEFKQKINIDALVKVIEREELSEVSRAEMEMIKKDPYKLEVYTETVLRVRAFYTAVNAIYTEMVKNQSRGAMGMTGDLLIKISSHFPFGLGFVVGFIGEIFGAVDDGIAKERIDNFIHFASAEEILIISDKIGRKIVSRDLGDPSESALDKAGNLAETAYKVVKTGPAALIVQACNKFKEHIEKGEYEETKEESDKARGRKHAEIISSIIVESIFTKSYVPKLMKGDFKARLEKLYKNEIEYKASAIASKVSKQLDLEKTEEDLEFDAASDDGIDTGRSSNSSLEEPSKCCTIMRVGVEYSNYFLRDGKELLEKANLVYGKEVVNQMLELGNDRELAEPILQEVKEQGAEKILDILFGNESPEPVLKLEMTNYFLQDKKGKELLEMANLVYGKEVLNQMLELGKDQEFAEYILQEAEEQGAEKILDILFGVTDQKAIADFSKIIENEDSPGFYQYIYNALSSNKFSKPAIETIKYIAHVYDKLEKMLSEGSSGNKVTIAMTILESLLSYAESGQFVGYRPSPYRGPDDGGDGPGGGNSGGVYFESNNGQEDNEMNHILLYEGVSINATKLAGLITKIENLDYGSDNNI